MWTQLVIVQRGKGDTRKWGFCIPKLRSHRMKNQNQPTPSLPLQSLPTQGWLLTQSWCELGTLQMIYRWAKAMFSPTADHEIFRMLSPTPRSSKIRGGGVSFFEVDREKPHQPPQKLRIASFIPSRPASNFKCPFDP